MRRRVLVIAFLFALVGAGAVGAAEQMPPVLERDPVLLDGGAAFKFGEPGPRTAILSERAPITGFAFGPGRLEVAYCGPIAKEGPRGLWVVNAQAPKADGERDARLYRTPVAPPRLVWTAPEGVTLRGPIWWAPNGAQIAVRSLTGNQCALMSADYATGEAVKLSQGNITAAAWSPEGKRIALVKESSGVSEMWLQTFPPGEERRLGEGGLDLRWSVDGKELHWIVAQPGETWEKKVWNAETEKLENAGGTPARPEGTLWSPNGRLCAAVVGEKQDRQLVIYPAGSTAGETVTLEGVHPQQVLGWTPDSHIVVMLADRNLPVAVSIMPEAGLPEHIKSILAAEHVTYPKLRASVVGPPLDAQPGPPSWSANMDMLAYVFRQGEAKELDFLRWQSPQQPTEEIRERLRDETLPKAETALIAVSVLRQAIPHDVAEKREDDSRLKTMVLSNVKNIAVALIMYLTDCDAFPEALTGEQLREILRPYVQNDSVFCLPDTDEVVVQYLIPPGTRPSDIEDAGITPMVVVEAVPGWDIVGFVDGHAQAIPEYRSDSWRQHILPPKE